MKDLFSMGDIASLLIIFLVIIIVIKWKKSLTLAMISGSVLTVLLYGLDLKQSGIITIKSLTSWSTISVLLVFYLITFIQRMLEKRGHIRLAEKALNGIFNNRRINASLASIFIGLLPSPGAVTLCSAIVENSCEDYLDNSEKAFIASFYRHIPEAFLPTYSSIIIALELSGLEVSGFLLGMIPMVALLILLGYIFYLRKIPKETGEEASLSKKDDLKNLVKSLWTIALTIFLILAFNMSVYLATAIAIVLSVIINKFKAKELIEIVPQAFESKIMISTAMIMVFKDLLTATGVVNILPDFFAMLPIPTFLVFALIFFFGTIISGSTAIIVLCMPMAFVAMPDGGIPLLVLLMSFSYAAMQISPTHVCLSIAAENFGIDMGVIIKKTIPVVMIFCLIVPFYYLLLRAIF